LPQLMELMPKASAAETENVATTFVSTPSLGETETTEGHVIFGGVESIVIVNVGQL